MSNTSIYNDPSYFLSQPDGSEQIAFETCQMRYGSQTDALGYALGIPSWEEMRQILKYSGYGYENIPVVGAKRQCELLWNAKTRIPKGIVEIGGGRGELSVCSTHLGIRTYMVEPSAAASELINKTCQKFNMPGYLPELINKNICDGYHDVDWNVIDTIILVESIEHIYPEDFKIAWEYVRSISHIRFIVCNWINYHPIDYGPPWHVQPITDGYYDWLSEGAKVIYRNGSHLVLEW